MSMNLPSIGSAQTPYGLASIHVGRYPVGGALFVELYTADDEFCVKSWSENEPLIEPLLATGLFEDTGRRTATGYAVSPTWRIKDPQFVPPRRGR